ncbi:outer mitochondrial transmembrane helix translocase [Lathyrus oleraceus]|uniref:outer mitochondrial transmembrane helix translocase n=1 Tax=Pisum sativum TaxID=3888 RepID=UPI0021D16C3A|nr:outer mitochondrial transmembrane helix translocase-like [Pisum sativum]
MEQIGGLFPNKLTIHLPKDHTSLSRWKQQLEHHVKSINAQLNAVTIRSIMNKSAMHCPDFESLYIDDQALTTQNAHKIIGWALSYPGVTVKDSSIVLSSESISYGHNILKKIQNSEKKLNNSVKDVFIDGELEEKVMADVISPSDIGITFNDIGALENVKNTLRELIMLPLQRPELFSKGQLTKPCKGILLFGPPGTGKTMLAKAIATEAGANFINVSLSSIISKWSGESEKYIKALFSIAHKIAPTVIFIDEVDSLLGKRGGADSSYNDAHYNKIKTEFFVHWDGLRTNENNRVLVLTATNRPWDLDDAVIRRLPRRLLINLPDASNREKILKLILAADHLSMDVDLEELANKTSGYSGSDLKDLCVAAAYCPIRERLEIEKKEGSELYSSVDIRPLKMEDLLHALKEVRASFKLDSSIMDELRKWNEQFGGAADESKEERYMNYFI